MCLPSLLLETSPRVLPPNHRQLIRVFPPKRYSLSPGRSLKWNTSPFSYSPTRSCRLLNWLPRGPFQSLSAAQEPYWQPCSYVSDFLDESDGRMNNILYFCCDELWLPHGGMPESSQFIPKHRRKGVLPMTLLGAQGSFLTLQES